VILSLVAAVFGSEFAAHVFDLALGVWSDPIHSKYGDHLVYLDDQSEPGVISFAEARPQLVVDWKHEHRSAEVGKMLREIRKRYTLVNQSRRTEDR
jgi:parvulin-like peptidyl-prolyl isomerase